MKKVRTDCNQHWPKRWNHNIHRVKDDSTKPNQLYHPDILFSIRKDACTMKLPNGYGNVSKLSGNRRNPWRVRKTVGFIYYDRLSKKDCWRISKGFSSAFNGSSSWWKEAYYVKAEVFNYRILSNKNWSIISTCKIQWWPLWPTYGHNNIFWSLW